MTIQQLEFLKVLRRALEHPDHPAPVSAEILQEADDQTVYALLSDDTKAYTIEGANLRIIWEQDEAGKALKGIPYAVIKGTAAAVCYPDPIRRTLGDIDLIVKPEDFRAAYQALTDAGYHSRDPADTVDRHAHFFRNGVSLELHMNFALLQTRQQEKLLDGWIYDALPSAKTASIKDFPFPMLPDELNGLVLLTHINQHLEEGLGIRQILDWVMYVRQHLPDAAWPAFRLRTDMLGLTKLAKAAAKLGVTYLGLDVSWCMDIDDRVVEDLLDYIFESGNFGQKDAANNTVTMVMSHGRGVKGFFRNLQTRGKANWAACRRHGWLKPFAWLYQLGRYIRLGLKKSSVKDFGKNFAASQRRNRLMDELGVLREAYKE